MSDYTEELLKTLSMVGSAGRRLINTASMKKKAPAQQMILDILLEEDGMTQGVLAEILDIRPSSLTEVLNKLENRGEIERREDPKDKRIKQVFITEKGRSKATPLHNRQNRSEEFFAGLSEEEQKQLDQLLNKVVDGWQGEFADWSDIPTNPFENLDSLKEFRNQFDKDFLKQEFRNMSPHERRAMKRAMKDRMRRQFGQRPPFGGNDFGGFGGMPFGDCKDFEGHQKNDKKESDGEWDNW